ncbi:MAG: hypothetical protein IT350_20240 [Deltaproteobacteria bacterium]|nr:hypothetical protein [Deltaproteobacteria bacterium]
MKARWILFLALCMSILMTGAAFAQDDDTADDDTADDDTADDDTADDDTADDDADDDMQDDDTDDDAADDDAADEFAADVFFTAPDALEPDTTYDFAFEVHNNTVAGDTQRWILQVDMFMPSANYAVNTDDLSAPDALHDGEWTAEADETPDGVPGIRWIYNGLTTSESYGDIREGEYLSFAFSASSDGDATDGFDWRVVADSGDELSGVAYINEADDDDTDDDSGDDDAADGDDDDDDDSGGCGC